MAIVLSNDQLSKDFWRICVRAAHRGKPGQFYLLRAWDKEPVLSRPVSIFDQEEDRLSFLYKTVGRGTERIAALKPGDDLYIQGPLGNWFPEALSGKVALVGGGVGIAPLYYAAREYMRQGGCCTDIYLGFREEALLEEAYGGVCRKLTCNVGGFVTDEIDPAAYDRILTCGPMPMMDALYRKCAAAGAAGRLLVSMENRMACGIGSCLVCTCRTASGNRKVCKDGPVFLAEEIFGGPDYGNEKK